MKIHLKTLSTSVVTKIRSEVGAYVRFEIKTCFFAISIQKSYFYDNDAIYDDIMQELVRKLRNHRHKISRDSFAE